MTSQVWLGDLVRALAAVPAADASQRTLVAAGLGLRFEERPEGLLSLPVPSPVPMPVPSDDAQPALIAQAPAFSGPPPPTAKCESIDGDATQTVGAVAMSRFLEALPASAIPIGKRAPQPTSAAARVGLRHEPLFPPARLRRFENEHLVAHLAEGAIDVASLVPVLARRGAVDSVPRLLRSSHRRGIQVLLDRGEGMQAFRTDEEHLVEGLRRRFGHRGCEVLHFRRTPLAGCGSGPVRTWTAWRAPRHGTAVLAVTDLGIAEVFDRGKTADWSTFLQGRAARTVVLVPYPRSRWPHALRRMAGAEWDRAAGSARRSVQPPVSAGTPSLLVQLAAFAALSIRTESSLLRAMRLQLLPGSPTALEADVWFSPWVNTRNLNGITFEARAADWLRGHLEAIPEARDRARALVKAWHAGIASAVQVEEEVAWIATRLGSAGLQQIEALLGDAVRAIALEEREGLRHWAAQAVARLPAVARTSVSAHLLSAAAAAVQPRPTLLADTPAAVFGLSEPLLRRMKRTAVGLRRLSQSLVIEAPGASTATGEGTRFELLVPITEPLKLRMQVGDQVPEVIELPAAGVVRRDVGSSAIRLRTLDGLELEIPPPASRPDVVQYPPRAPLPLPLPHPMPLPRHLPVELLDRQVQVEEAREWVQGRMDAPADTPPVCVLHGKADQGHEELIRRIVRIELPHWPGLDNVIELRIHSWHAGVSLRTLVASLLDAARGDRSQDDDEAALASALARLDAPVCCVLHVDTIEWSETSRATLEDWARLWQGLGSASRRHPWLPLLSIRRPAAQPRPSIVRRLLGLAPRDGSASTIEAMQTSRLFRALSELGSISLDEARAWVHQYVHDAARHDLADGIMKFYSTQGAERIPMASLVQELKRLADLSS